MSQNNVAAVKVLPSTNFAVKDDGARDRPAKSFSVATLGCKVNSFESELIAQKLTEDNYCRVTADAPADLCVINTCTVTAEADRQARQLVRRAVRNNPNAWVVVTGCYAQMDADTCAAIPGVDLVVGNDAKLNIPQMLDAMFAGELPSVMVGDVDEEISLPTQLLGGFDGRVRAFLQVQQGCDQGCTFCIIHKARGPNRSFAPSLIIRQAERLVMNGYRELVICGVDVGGYGLDFADGENISLTALLKQITAIDGDFRVRLSSIDPAHITDELIECIASDSKICPQLHLSLQSANTLILKRMKRRATREIIYERIEKLRNAVPELVLSADIMTGFPTETIEHFHDTLSAVDELEIAYPHVFAYSPRPHTPAAKIPAQVPPVERKRRAALVRARGGDVWRRVAARRVGSRTRVLVESGGAEGVLRGRASDYFPVDLPVDSATDSANEIQVGDWAEVEIASVDYQSLIARRLAAE